MQTTVRLLVGLILALVLASCETGAVVFAPTPLPPDLSPRTISHPSGAFSLQVPPDWAVYTQDSNAIASMSFSPPGYDSPVLTAASILLAQPGDVQQLANDYQTIHRPDLRRYIETAREQQPDGSWRFSGVRTLSDGSQVPLNTFFALNGAQVLLIEAVVTGDEALRASNEYAINSLRPGLAPTLTPSDLSALSFVNTAAYEILNTAAWTNPTGVLFVTGEIANHTALALEPIPVRVALLNAAGEVVTEASDSTMGYAVKAGGFAPFSLRFGQGQPIDTVRFRVLLGDDPTRPLSGVIVGAPDLSWTDESTFTPEGHLIVSGTVTNTGNLPVRDPLAVITVFDGSGDVIGAWFQPLLTPVIGAGETVNYEVRVLELGGGARNYIVDIQARGG